MEFSATVAAPHRVSLLRPLNHHRGFPPNYLSFASSSSRSSLGRSISLSVRSSSFPAAAPATAEEMAPAIAVTEKALSHLRKMRSERGEDLCLRIGVKQGGCSGMSYTMDFENRANARADDSLIEYDGFAIGNLFFSLLYLIVIFTYVPVCISISSQHPNHSTTWKTDARTGSWLGACCIGMDKKLTFISLN
ncbi:hypothetical protein Tsubulata_018956 [Turnera subulata]|uniref:Core domain-containing protein n=1 Tax=Turnera subulata TaxID=218843 RepID=A0A9Q0FB56_9ROSI|nr:hypothetical protein Tsubulata_018956 [Turnera subulata]